MPIPLPTNLQLTLKNATHVTSCNNVKQKTTLESEYSKLRANHAGFPTADEPVFDTELVSKIICNLKLRKAADIDGLTGEHLLHSHPILQVIISRREMMTFAKLI